ncbi:hypothetical protein C4J81_06210 [Deltaproteobacteria bacterium Smac51]|nr:hypothetical protein C4J81_06210 [Deltaproteobacteria bacterium Smac51]
MPESNHNHHGPNSLVWGARPCIEETDKYPLRPDLLSYEELLCQLTKHLRDIDQRIETQSSGAEPDLSYEEQWTGRWDRTDPDGPTKIYVKTVACGTAPADAFQRTVAHGVVDLKVIVDLKGIFVTEGTSRVTLMCSTHPLHASFGTSLYATKTDIIVSASVSGSGGSTTWLKNDKMIVTLYYTKNE